jgi:hypothetical protein
MITIREFSEALEQLASQQDPIFVYGDEERDGRVKNVFADHLMGYPSVETTAEDLCGVLGDACDVSKYRIGYYSRDGYIKKGTFEGLVRDRNSMKYFDEGISVSRDFDDIIKNLV